LLSDDENSASAQRHATHRGKISGRYNLCWGCKYNFSRHQWNSDLMCMYLKNLVNSMPKRLQDVIRREGNHTNY
jgi:hypothetical protein